MFQIELCGIFLRMVFTVTISNPYYIIISSLFLLVFPLLFSFVLGALGGVLVGFAFVGVLLVVCCGFFFLLFLFVDLFCCCCFVSPHPYYTL